MPLTAHDLKQIKSDVVDVVDPRFKDTNQRIDQANQTIESTKLNLESKLGQIKSDVDELTSATNRKFHAVFTDVAVMREDIHVVKQLVTEHGFRIAELEHPGDTA